MPGSDVLACLQICISHVIAGVQFFARLTVASCGGRSGYVGVDGSLPISKSRECMRWHVYRVRGCRSKLPKVLCSPRGAHSQRRDVIRVDDVVCQSRMIWIPNVQTFQYSPGLELPSIRFIGRVCGGGERKRVEDG